MDTTGIAGLHITSNSTDEIHETATSLWNFETMETTEIAGLYATSNSTEESLQYGLALTPFQVFVMIFTTLTILLILILNPLMLFTLRRVTSIQPTTKIFMASLTLSDLGSGTFSLFKLVEMFAGSWLLGEFLCVAINGLIVVCNTMSCTSLLFLTVDRYIAITCPLRYPSLMTEFRFKTTVCIAWAVTFLILMLMRGINNRINFLLDSPYRRCILLTDDWRTYLLVTVVAIILATIFILYAHIILIARNQARRIAAENQAGNGRGGQRKNTRSTTTVIIITGTLIITWIPTLVITAISLQSKLEPNDRDAVVMLTQALLLSNGWLNVVIYYLRNRDLRQELCGLLSDWRQCLTQTFLH